MKVLVDEDCPKPMLDLLRHVLPAHTVHHVTERKWSGKKDLVLLTDAKADGYQVFLTNDCNQLNDPAETRAIKKAGMHHVRYSQRRQNLEGLALAIGAVVSAMPSLIAELEGASGQRLVHIAGLNPTGRYEIKDPRKDPRGTGPAESAAHGRFRVQPSSVCSPNSWTARSQSDCPLSSFQRPGPCTETGDFS
ncbi:hypothetical protein GCM10010182_40900 [Actinomadura cremea]|nr:hypothetical protein GCM10010182_40900 [Actinomadura cremea]